jgi:hypothetical protein
MSGIICTTGANRFFWTNFQAAAITSATPLILNPEPCPDGATTVGYAHTHPPDFPKPGDPPPPPGAPVFEPGLYPSGYWAASHYHDAHPGTPDQQPSDLKIADMFFSQTGFYYPQPKAADVTWFLASQDEYNGRPVNFFRYKKTSQLDAKDNLFRYNPAANNWVHVPSRW